MMITRFSSSFVVGVPVVSLAVLSISAVLHGAALARIAQHKDRVLRRVRTFGSALRVSKEPWPGATVTLFARAAPTQQAATQADVVRIDADVKGRFAAMLLPGFRYSAFAISSLRSGKYGYSRFALDVTAGRPVKLRELPDRNHTVRVRVAGVKAWSALEPLRYRVTATLGRHRPRWSRLLSPDVNGEVVLPSCPTPTVRFSVLGKSGLVLFEEAVVLDSARRAKAAAECAGLDERTRGAMPVRTLDVGVDLVRVPPPRRLWLSVRSQENGPIPLARIYGYDHGSGALVGRTEKNGRVLLELPRSTGQDFIWIVQAPGYAERVFAWDLIEPFSGGKVPVEKDGIPSLTLGLKPGYTLRGRLLFDEGRPASDVQLLYDTDVMLDRGAMLLDDFRTVRTDNEGRFEISGMNPEIEYQVYAAIGPRKMSSLPLSADYPMSPLIRLAYCDTGQDRDLGTINLARWQRVDFDLVDSSCVPVPDVEVVVGGEQRPQGFYCSPRQIDHFLGNRYGRLRLLVPPVQGLAVAASYRDAFALTELGNSRKVPIQPKRVQLTLRTPLYIRGTLTDTKGRPLNGSEMVLCRLGDSVQGPELLITEITKYRSYFSWLVDGQGRFRIPVPQTRRQYELSVVYNFQGGSAIDSEWKRAIRVDEHGVDGVKLVIDTRIR